MLLISASFVAVTSSVSGASEKRPDHKCDFWFISDPDLYVPVPSFFVFGIRVPSFLRSRLPGKGTVKGAGLA